jgi:hypothetical protein
MYTANYNPAYDVSGLPTPYLGFDSYSHNERKRFGGRERAIKEATLRLTGFGASVFFVTGASGAGKTSFVQAGLVPTLEKFYADNHKATVTSFMQPGNYPLSSLNEALATFSPNVPFDLSVPGAFTDFLQTQTNFNTVNLLVIERFEEVITRAHAGQRDILLNLLENLPPFAAARTHVIITLDEAFLPEFLKYARLSAMLKTAYHLPELTLDELRDVIRRPLDYVYAPAGKALDPVLVENLAQEAAQLPNPLPRLAAALGLIWQRGDLSSAAYSPGLVKTAVDVYANKLLETGANGKPRPKNEQTEILDICTGFGLPEWWQNAAVPRPRRDVEMNSPLRARLIEELLAAKLLKLTVENGHEELELAHRRLLTDWEPLAVRIQALQHEFHAGRRFRYALQNWVSAGRGFRKLLNKPAQQEAAELRRRQDPVVFSPDGAKFYWHSYLKNFGLRWLGGAAGVAVLIFMTTMVLLHPASPYKLGPKELRQPFQTISFSPNSSAITSIAYSPDGSSIAVSMGINEQDARVWNSLSLNTAYLKGHTNGLSAIAYSPDGKWLATSSYDRSVRLWDATTRQEMGGMLTFRNGVYKVFFSQDGQYLITLSPGDPQPIRILNVANRQIVFDNVTRQLRLTGAEHDMALSPDNRWLVVASYPHYVKAYELNTGVSYDLRGKNGYKYNQFYRVVYSRDGRYLALAGFDSIELMTGDGRYLRTLKLNNPRNIPLKITSISLSPNGQLLAAGDDAGGGWVWETASGNLRYTIQTGEQPVRSVMFHPDSRQLAIGGNSGKIKIWKVS